MVLVGRPAAKEAQMEYLVTMTTHVPSGTTDAVVDDIRARESAHTRELAAQGHVLRLWRPPLAPGEWRMLGLFATGEIVRKRTSEASSSQELTPQERQIALLVRDGLTNPEVGAQLFLSPRTVER